MRNQSTILVLAASATLLLFSTGCEKLRARDNLNQGVNAFKNAKFADAVSHFKTAVELDPSLASARLYLATAYRSQYIPGAESDENRELARRAMEEFTKVYNQEPNNKLALQSIASLHYDEAQGLTALEDKFKKLDEAKSWHEKILKVDPSAKESLYTIGVIAWAKTYPIRKKARVELKMKDEEPGPIKDVKVRTKLAERNTPILEEGINAMRKAIEVDKEYDDAMAYLNLLLREKADIADTPALAKQFSEEADSWVQKAVETKKIKAARMPTQTGIVSEEAPAKK
ncbi:MAG: hypothetical protein K2X03_10225 [Bryobacteraceae bacterium]|nr:hypothetical protein [Bryobacteraceae bacterium]